MVSRVTSQEAHRGHAHLDKLRSRDSHEGATWVVTALAVTAPCHAHEMSHQDGAGLTHLPNRVCLPCGTASVFGGKKEVGETYQGQQTE